MVLLPTSAVSNQKGDTGLKNKTCDASMFPMLTAIVWKRYASFPG
jgi:hypothetical protein